MTEIRTLRTETTGRYLVERGPVPNAPLLVGFHGYGQNAETLLDDLRRIPGAEAWTLVSMQALHRFYSRSQHVVASWMTSQDREAAITDNLAYVARVIAELRAETGATKLVFAGFSQGAAMAYRATAHLKPCDGLIVLGGDLPKDVAELPNLALPPVLIGRGEQDNIYTAEQLAKDKAALEARSIRAEVICFNGGHGWGDGFLEKAERFLRQAIGMDTGPNSV